MNEDRTRCVVDLLKELSSSPAITPERNNLLADLGFTTSLRLLRLQSRLEKLAGISLPPLTASTTISRLLLLCGCPENDAVQTAEEEHSVHPDSGQSQDSLESGPPSLSDVSVLEIGTDIEEIDAFPESADFRDHDFYNAIFTPREVAYSLLFSEPKPHLAGMYCAKEAARKTFPEVTALEMKQIEVFRVKGKPYLRLLDTPLAGSIKFSVSISHSSNFATAVVLASLY